MVAAAAAAKSDMAVAALSAPVDINWHPPPGPTPAARAALALHYASLMNDMRTRAYQATTPQQQLALARDVIVKRPLSTPELTEAQKCDIDAFQQPLSDMLIEMQWFDALAAFYAEGVAEELLVNGMHPVVVKHLWDDGMLHDCVPLLCYVRAYSPMDMLEEIADVTEAVADLSCSVVCTLGYHLDTIGQEAEAMRATNRPRRLAVNAAEYLLGLAKQFKFEPHWANDGDYRLDALEALLDRLGSDSPTGWSDKYHVIDRRDMTRLLRAMECFATDVLSKKPKYSLRGMMDDINKLRERFCPSNDDAAVAAMPPKTGSKRASDAEKSASKRRA
jgi:hypothetical protein